MSALYLFPPEQEPVEDLDLLAAVYALGVMDPGDAAATRLRADADPALAAAIASWNARLALLTEVLQPGPPPPALWALLANDTGIALPATPPRPAPVEAISVEPPAVAPPVEATLPEVPPEPPPEPQPQFVPVIEPVTAERPAGTPAPTPPPVMYYAPPEPIPEPMAEPVPVIPPAPVRRTTPLGSGGLFMPLAVTEPPNPGETPNLAPAQSTPAWHENLLVWRIAAGAAFVVALVLGGLLMLHPRPSRAIAAIGPVSAPAPLFLAETDDAGHLTVTPLATIAVPSGRDLELWLLPPGITERPSSLGVLPASGRRLTLPSSPIEGTQLLISMEPRGGAANGILTSPVLYGGTLANH